MRKLICKVDQSSIYLAWIGPTNFIILELWKLHIHAYLELRETKDYLKIKENLWKCLPEEKDSKFIKNEIFLT